MSETCKQCQEPIVFNNGEWVHSDSVDNHHCAPEGTITRRQLESDLLQELLKVESHIAKELSEASPDELVKLCNRLRSDDPIRYLKAHVFEKD